MFYEWISNTDWLNSGSKQLDYSEKIERFFNIILDTRSDLPFFDPESGIH